MLQLYFSPNWMENRWRLTLGVNNLFNRNPPPCFTCDSATEMLFCDNDTNPRRLFGMMDAKGYFKDGVNDYIVHGDKSAVNPARNVHFCQRIRLPSIVKLGPSG